MLTLGVVGGGDPRGLGAYRLVEPALPAVAAAGSPPGRRMPSPWPWWASVLARHWEPLGVEQGLARNLVFVAVLIGGLLGAFLLFQSVIYRPLLRWCLDHKLLFLAAPTAIVLLGGSAWLGFRSRLRVRPLGGRQGWGRPAGGPPVAAVGEHDPHVSRPRPGVHAAARRGLVPLDADDDAARLDRRVDGRAPAPGHGDQRHPRGGPGRRQDRPGRQPARPGADLDGRDDRQLQVGVHRR